MPPSPLPPSPGLEELVTPGRRGLIQSELIQITGNSKRRCSLQKPAVHSLRAHIPWLTGPAFNAEPSLTLCLDWRVDSATVCQRDHDRVGARNKLGDARVS